MGGFGDGDRGLRSRGTKRIHCTLRYVYRVATSINVMAFIMKAVAHHRSQNHPKNNPKIPPPDERSPIIIKLIQLHLRALHGGVAVTTP